MNCHRVRRHLRAYLDGELDAVVGERVTAHLQGCAACQAELAEARRFDDYLRATDDFLDDAPGLLVPPDFTARVVTRARSKSATSGAPTETAWGWRQWLHSIGLPKPAFTLAVIALAVVCGYRVGRVATPLFVRVAQPQARALSVPSSNWMELVPRELAALDPSRASSAKVEKEIGRKDTVAGQ